MLPSRHLFIRDSCFPLLFLWSCHIFLSLHLFKQFLLTFIWRLSIENVTGIQSRLGFSCKQRVEFNCIFKNMPMYILLWFNFILGLIFIFLCLGVWKCMIMRLKERKIKLNNGQNWTTTYTLYKSLVLSYNF